MNNDRLLSIKNLRVFYYTEKGIVKAVDGACLDMSKGETLGVVGETGCGKSTLALSILRLIESPGRIVDGEITFEGENLLEKSEDEVRKVRGNKISMIFQNPMTSLNPTIKIGEQVSEVIRLHQRLQKKEALEEVVNVLQLVGLPNPIELVNGYPHELSGGMKQRIMIAAALSCKPALLLADEPTTALDVSIQAQILRLINELKEKIGTSVLLITHNLGVIAEICDRVVVMYAGEVLESGDIYTIFENPMHPYTKGLIEAIPQIEMGTRDFTTIPGTVPSLINPPSGCKFHPRCPFLKDRCSQSKPVLVDLGQGHAVSCFKHRD